MVGNMYHNSLLASFSIGLNLSIVFHNVEMIFRFLLLTTYCRNEIEANRFFFLLSILERVEYLVEMFVEKICTL